MNLSILYRYLVPALTYPCNTLFSIWLMSVICMLFQFDKGVRAQWDRAMADGYFRYNLDHMKTRVVAGDKHLVLQVG